MASRSRPFGAIVGLLALAWLFVPPPSSLTPRTTAPDVSDDAAPDGESDIPALPAPPATPDDPPDDARLLVRVLSGSGAPVSGATVRIAGTGAYPPRAMRTNGSGRSGSNRATTCSGTLPASSNASSGSPKTR